MIIPILRDIYFIKEPEDINDFEMGLITDITEEGCQGADNFRFMIITPKRLVKLLSEDKIFSGRATFIVNEPDMESNIELVKAEINKFLPDCARETWEEVALAVNCYLEWEYYDPSCGICDFYKNTMMNLPPDSSKPKMTIEDVYARYLEWEKRTANE